jgi:hypothetical protein
MILGPEMAGIGEFLERVAGHGSPKEKFFTLRSLRRPMRCVPFKPDV